MSTTPGPDLVSPLSEPERHLREGLRRRACEIAKYFPPDKTARYRAKITGFCADDYKSLHAGWEGFKGLLRKCPHHGLSRGLQCRTFFDALSGAQKQAVDQVAGGDFGRCTPNEVLDVLERAAKKSFAYNLPRSIPSTKGVLHVDSNTLVSAQLEALTKRFDQMQSGLAKSSFYCGTIENQVGQIAQLFSARPQGSLPSNTETNPRAEAKAITLRSGRSTIPVDASVSTPKPIADEIETETPSEVQPRLIPESTTQTSEPVRTYVPPIPYPGRLKKQKMEEQYGKFLELFKQLHINLPFLDALIEMPKYAKFLKEVLLNKKKLEELSCVTLNEECSVVLQNKLPKKMTVPDSFTIPCLIGSLSVSNALADLGASINLMPYYVFVKLDLGEPKPTCMSIQLAGRSVKYPRGIVENILVKIDKFVFPVDFVILDMDEDKNVPLILGRPFLATARALIDVCTGRLTHRVGDEEVTFDIGRSVRHPHDHDDVLYIDTVESCVCENIQDMCEEYSLDTQLCVRGISDLVSGPLFEELVCGVDHEPPECLETIEDVDRVAEPKELLSHLEYAFLEDGSRLPVIISASLLSEEKVKLLAVLKRHKHAIAWKIMDIKGISPSFCTHKILMEEKYKPVCSTNGVSTLICKTL
ncbi:uncharacterized protein LOC143634070 [Bidens hawaiensis]|uniref:uncharacterized protein LOC143634070 n=1 Tax=Bidens hawaiensis TaxID=980011 RepID=UPI004049BFD1